MMISHTNRTTAKQHMTTSAMIRSCRSRGESPLVSLDAFVSDIYHFMENTSQCTIIGNWNKLTEERNNAERIVWDREARDENHEASQGRLAMLTNIRYALIVVAPS